MIVKRDVTVTFDKNETETLSKIMEMARQRLRVNTPASLGLTDKEFEDVDLLVTNYFSSIF